MKILFMCPFINNTHFMKSILVQLNRNLLNCEYTFLILNDAFDIDNGEEDYLNLISILSEETNCYKEIYEERKLKFMAINFTNLLHQFH